MRGSQGVKAIGENAVEDRQNHTADEAEKECKGMTQEDFFERKN